MFLCPILKYQLKIRAYPDSLLHQFFTVIVEKKFQAVGDKQQVKNEVFVFWMIAITADNISDIFWVFSDQFIFDIPISLSNHVCKEYPLDLVHQKDFWDCFQHFIDRIAESNIAAASHWSEDGYQWFNLISRVVVEGFAVLGWDVAILVVLFAHHEVPMSK